MLAHLRSIAYLLARQGERAERWQSKCERQGLTRRITHTHTHAHARTTHAPHTRVQLCKAAIRGKTHANITALRKGSCKDKAKPRTLAASQENKPQAKPCTPAASQENSRHAEVWCRPGTRQQTVTALLNIITLLLISAMGSQPPAPGC